MDGPPSFTSVVARQDVQLSDTSYNNEHAPPSVGLVAMSLLQLSDQLTNTSYNNNEQAPSMGAVAMAQLQFSNEQVIDTSYSNEQAPSMAYEKGVSQSASDGFSYNEQPPSLTNVVGRKRSYSGIDARGSSEFPKTIDARGSSEFPISTLNDPVSPSKHHHPHQTSLYNTDSSSGMMNANKMMIEDEWPVKSSNNVAFDSVESLVRIKEAEARMFQNQADEARREAEGYTMLIRTMIEKLDEEYTKRISKLNLHVIEDQRKKKAEELKVLEDDHCESYR